MINHFIDPLPGRAANVSRDGCDRELCFARGFANGSYSSGRDPHPTQLLRAVYGVAGVIIRRFDHEFANARRCLQRVHEEVSARRVHEKEIGRVALRGRVTTRFASV